MRSILTSHLIPFLFVLPINAKTAFNKFVRQLPLKRIPGGIGREPMFDYGLERLLVAHLIKGNLTNWAYAKNILIER